ncbi:hypothetical protein DSO57_1015105 [Entomophthora muscae]|uniref:Uncharacterized protein n=1 Tax=Entomophthora muscae TaxID=34485 RepID=A0ACC2U308_9FUNG|nr:hypothetical protein DSO57_1015105 [Entomophthora muscae]
MTSFLKRTLRRTHIRRSIFTAIGLALFCAIVIPVFYSYRREGTRKGSHFEFSTQDLSDDRVELQFNLLNMDPVNRKAEILVQVDLLGDLQDGEGALVRNMTINLRYKQLRFMAQQVIEPFMMTVPFTEGTLRDYPLEIFIADFPIIVHGNSSIPFHATFDGSSQVFKIRFNVISPSEVPPDSSIQNFSPKPDAIVQFRLHRPPTTLMICVFMGALMWVLAVAMVNLALDAVIYHRDIPPSSTWRRDSNVIRSALPSQFSARCTCYGVPHRYAQLLLVIYLKVFVLNLTGVSF